jgi:hypothetical protein
MRKILGAVMENQACVGCYVLTDGSLLQILAQDPRKCVSLGDVREKLL